MSENKLLQNLSSNMDQEHGPSVKLISFEHQDYIDDVLAEHFNIVCTLKTIDEDNKVYILHFEQSVTLTDLNLALAKINEFHSLKSVIYDTI